MTTSLFLPQVPRYNTRKCTKWWPAANYGWTKNCREETAVKKTNPKAIYYMLAPISRWQYIYVTSEFFFKFLLIYLYKWLRVCLLGYINLLPSLLLSKNLQAFTKHIIIIMTNSYFMKWLHSNLFSHSQFTEIRSLCLYTYCEMIQFTLWD